MGITSSLLAGIAMALASATSWSQQSLQLRADPELLVALAEAHPDVAQVALLCARDVEASEMALGGGQFVVVQRSPMEVRRMVTGEAPGEPVHRQSVRLLVQYHPSQDGRLVMLRVSAAEPNLTSRTMLDLQYEPEAGKTAKLIGWRAF